MQVTINQQEIERAIIAYVGNQGITLEGTNVKVNIHAGRGPNGLSASIDITNEGDEAVEEEDDSQQELPLDKPAAKVVADVKEEPATEEAVEEDSAEEPEETPLFGQK